MRGIMRFKQTRHFMVNVLLMVGMSLVNVGVAAISPVGEKTGVPLAANEYKKQGLAYFQAGQFTSAAQKFMEMVKQARLQKNNGLLMSSLIDLGNAESALQQFGLAYGYYLEAAELASKNGLAELAAKAYSNAARNEILQNRTETANGLLRLANQQSQHLPENRDKAELLLGIGHLWQQNGIGGFAQAYQAITNGLAIAEKQSLDDLRAYGYGYLSTLYLGQFRLTEALQLNNQAEFIAQTINKPDIVFRWQWQAGRILAKQGAKTEAIAAYQRAIANLKPIRGELRRLSLGDDLIGLDVLYLELADLLLQKPKLSEAELLVVRDIIEQGKSQELEDYYRDDCVAKWLDKSSRIDLLQQHTAALYPIMFNDRLELLLSLPKGLQRYTVVRNKKEVSELVTQLRLTLENRATPEFLPHAQALYDVLIRPLQADLKKDGIDTLVFIPDASFRTIPLAALHDGNDFLIKHYAIATSPGLRLTDPKPIQREDSATLVAALSESREGFPALPNVSGEVHRITEQFPATLLENQAFQINRFRQQLQDNPFRVVHIASHGQFDKNSANTFLLASDGKINLDALSNMMGVNRYRNNPVELLTLSACQTAAGDDRAALGLAGVAVKSGARSALASLWFINDKSSADLVAEFYRQLKTSNLSKARALQKAQWLLMDDERYEHPGYWAPFLMIGNWL